MWPVCNSGITQFYLPPTHEPYLHLVYSPTAARRHRPLAGTHCAYLRIDGQAELTWVAGPHYVQNAAARLITNTRRCQHITPVLQQLHWLPVRQRVQFKMAVLVYKTLHDLLPAYLA